MGWLDDMTNSVDMNLSKLGVMVNYRKAWCAAVLESQRVGHDSATEQKQNKLHFQEHITYAYYIQLFLMYFYVVQRGTTKTPLENMAHMHPYYMFEFQFSNPSSYR